MNVTEVKEAYRRRPFVPFRIHYEGGAPVEVGAPESMMFSPVNQIVFVNLREGGDVRIHPSRITRLEVIRSAFEDR